MPNKVDILGVNVDAMTMSESVAQIETYMAGEEPVMIATANAEMIMRATQDEELRDILNRAAIVTADGAGTVWAARHLGYEMPERVAGYDLAQQLMKNSVRQGQRIYFFGSAPGVAEKAKAKAEQLYPGIQIVGTRDGYFTEADEPAIIEDIKAKRPHLLLVALGVPKQEKWLAKHQAELGVPVAIGVGGTLDVMAGVMKRAPLWMQKAKLEWLFRGWLFRGMLQPKRAGRLLALPKFVLKVHGSRG